MSRKNLYDTFLTRLLDAIRQSPKTARTLAEELGCSKPTVYARIEGLRRRGHVVQEVTVRDGTRGPLAQAYALGEAPAGESK